ncbi:MAG: hypothetical protein ACKVP0_03365 [Pirellulaceae bacterium]
MALLLVLPMTDGIYETTAVTHHSRFPSLGRQAGVVWVEGSESW